MEGAKMNPPEYECDNCGVCCKAFLIFASDADVEREPRIVAHSRKLPGSQETPEWKYQLYPLPFLEACDFLGEDKRCDIYETRPHVCRKLQAGDAQCQDARVRNGLEELKPAIECQPPME